MQEPLAIARLAPLVKQGRLAPLDIVERCLKQIDRFEQEIRAWVLIDADGARRAAEEHGREIADGGWRGPLHGMPIGIKDIIDVRGMPTRAGSSLTSPQPAGEDAPLVAGLRAAGAILLGKTVTTEFACFDPPSTRNPWNLDRTPGGSSSGSAAAVASRMCLAAVGTQTGGSITRPASYCGVAGCKPTFGTIDTAGIVPVSAHLDHPGPIAQCVADLAILLGAMRGAESPQATNVVPVSPPRLGIIEPYFMERASADVSRATRTAIAHLQEAGAHFVSASLPDEFADVHAMHRRIMAAGIAAQHGKQFQRQPGGFGPTVTALVEQGLAVSTQQLQAALDHQQRMKNSILRSFDGVDALVTPATLDTAPTPETTGDSSFNSPFSYAGLPTVSLPCGLAGDGMPVALQLVGRRNEDADLLAHAAWCEERLAFAETPALNPKSP